VGVEAEEVNLLVGAEEVLVTLDQGVEGVEATTG
jgi:hypothetical protein